MTNEVDGGSGHALDAALSLVREGLARLGELPLWQLSDAQLRGAAAGLDQVRLLGDGQLVRLLAEVDSRGLPGQDGSGSLGGWLRQVAPTMRPGEAAGLAKQATTLYRSALSADLAPTRAALEAGALRMCQARVVTDTVAKGGVRWSV